MLSTKVQNFEEIHDTARMELYRLIEEGYKAMLEGRINTMEEVREKINQRKQDWG